MTKIILTRHGHVEGIEPKRFRGRTELALTARGRAEAKAVAARIAEAWKPARVYTSPMGRCIATGHEIALACGVGDEVMPLLNDLDYGQWRWRSDDEVRAQWPDLFTAWHASPHLMRFPDGESLQELVARTAEALSLARERHPGETETVVLVGHDSVNRALLLQLLDQPLSAYWRLAQSPCAVNEIDVVGGSIRVQRINETAHLSAIS
jgi:phosphoserine phosphatase